MASEGSHGSGWTPADTLETLKRLKQAEVESDSRLRTVVAEGEKLLADLKTNVEAAVHGTRLAVDRHRETTLQETRRQADSEAAQILADGEGSAKAVAPLAAKDLDRLREKLLDTVVGEFRKSGIRAEP
jgi:vacuolar-type H+-ATPase subunit H